MFRLVSATAAAAVFSPHARNIKLHAAAEGPWPSFHHQTYTNDQLKGLGWDADAGGRIILVGDVHGCADELVDLLIEVEWKKGR